MKQWHDLLRRVLDEGVQRPDRTGTGTLALFGEQLTFDNSRTFPAVTTKQLAFRQVCAELACFVRGHSLLSQFKSIGCNIWDGNGLAPVWLKYHTLKDGDVQLGRIYGVQWRKWRKVKQWQSGELTFDSNVDQLVALLNGMTRDPYGRRHIVTAWNPGELEEMCLPPCPLLFQCFVRPCMGSTLPYVDMRVDVRSSDLFLGLPFDVASYAVLQRLIAKEVGMLSGKLVFQLGDAHIYFNHLDQVNEVLSRVPMKPPYLNLEADASLLQFLPDQVELVGYTSHPPVKAPLNI